MTNYGYRLWAVDLHIGMKRDRHEFRAAHLPVFDAEGQQGGGERIVDYLSSTHTDIQASAGQTHNFGLTKGDDDEGPAASSGASIRFGGSALTGISLRMKLEYGLRHTDGTLIDPSVPDSEDVPLKNKSTLHPYRATLVAAPGAYRGLLAVETRGRACPMVSLVRALRAISSEGFRVKAVSHVASEAAMLDYIANAEIKRVNFDQWSFNDDGQKTRREVALGVISQIEGREVRDAVGRWCTKFFDVQREHVVDEDVEAANEPDLSGLTVAERREYRRARAVAQRAERQKLKVERRLLGRQINHTEAGQLKSTIFATRGDDVTIDFTDVSVDMLNNGAKRIFNPLSDFQKLTYALGTRLPGDERFFRQAEETATNLLDGVQELPGG